MHTFFRTAELTDIKQMQVVRHLVKENTLSNPDLVPDKDVAYYITEKGKGWVCEADGQVVGLEGLIPDHTVRVLFPEGAWAV